MLGKVQELLKPSPIIPQCTDSEQIEVDYKYWRFRICYSLFFGYAAFYLTRKSFTVAAPTMANQFDISLTSIGYLGTILYIVYGISKFLAGITSDRSNPRYFMAFGLIATGVLNILFGLSSSFIAFAIFWGLNGFFQAWGWPACTKSLTYWFKQSDRGFWYSLVSTSHNVGGAIIAVLAIYLAESFGWRYAMFVPAVISISMGFWLINRLRDEPRTLGLPCVHESEYPTKNSSLNDRVLSIKDVLFKQVLNNKYVWIFSISYFFVYVVRTGINDWIVFFLRDEKDISPILSGVAVSGFEVGGLLGMVAAGWGSDYFFKGNRVPVMIICSLGLVGSILALWTAPSGAAIWDIFLISSIGFFVFGPQMIVGLAAAEFVDKRAAAASNGFAGTLGYFGAAASCSAIGYIVDNYGWEPFFWTLFLSSVIICLLLLPFRHVKDPNMAKTIHVSKKIPAAAT